ncbi:hypothetical protein ACP70R_016267 [Stipagrostis hirtigluma subsp. patula]
MELLMETDGNGNEYLDYGAFVAVTIHLKRLSNNTHLRTAFLFFNKDNSGYIERAALADALADDEAGNTNDAALDNVLREVDTNKDGRISFEEFMAMMKAGRRKASRQYSRPPSSSTAHETRKRRRLLPSRACN